MFPCSLCPHLSTCVPVLPPPYQYLCTLCTLCTYVPYAPISVPVYLCTCVPMHLSQYLCTLLPTSLSLYLPTLPNSLISLTLSISLISLCLTPVNSRIPLRVGAHQQGSSQTAHNQCAEASQYGHTESAAVHAWGALEQPHAHRSAHLYMYRIDRRC
jgi:hypothetical protein